MAVTAGQIRKQRNASLDAVRAIAILLVVLNHAVEAVYPISDPKAMASFGTLPLIFCCAAYVLGRIGVPLFLMLSGYLLLPRDFFASKAGVWNFYKKNLLPLLLTFEIWVLLYNILLAVWGEQAFSAKNWLMQAFFVREISPSHAWYVPMILGLYLFVPLLSKILSLMRGKWILLLLGITYVYFFLAPFLALWLKDLKVILNLNFSGGVCGLYLILGYLMYRWGEEIRMFFYAKGRRALFAAAAILVFAATAGFYFLKLHQGAKFSLWYEFFTLPFLGVAAFLLLKQIRPAGRSAAVFREIAVCSFGIYLVHKLILEAQKRYLPGFSPVAEVIVYMILAFLVSFVLVTLIGRIGKGRVGKVLFLRK